MKKIRYGQIVAYVLIIYFLIEFFRSLSLDYVSYSWVNNLKVLMVDIFVTFISFGIVYFIHTRKLIQKNILGFLFVVFTLIFSIFVGSYFLAIGFWALGQPLGWLGWSLILGTIVQRLLIIPFGEKGYEFLKHSAVSVVLSFIIFFFVFEGLIIFFLIPFFGNIVPNTTAAQIISSVFAIIYYSTFSIYMANKIKNTPVVG